MDAFVGDSQIRSSLKRHLGPLMAPGDSLVEELGLLNGDVRADLVWLNGTLHGFEIKSTRDTLSRLANQVAAYSRVMQHTTAVLAERHLVRATPLVPSWWGIILVPDGTADLVQSREAIRNPLLDKSAVARLLWRDEVLEELTTLGMTRQLRKMPCRELWLHLANALSPDELQSLVTRRLKQRAVWRSVQQQPPGGATFQFAAM